MRQRPPGQRFAGQAPLQIIADSVRLVQPFARLADRAAEAIIVLGHAPGRVGGGGQPFEGIAGKLGAVAQAVFGGDPAAVLLNV